MAKKADNARGRPTVIVGLGRTGLSCARFLASRGEPFIIADSRDAPPGLGELRREVPDAELDLGPFDANLFAAAGQLLVSPGVALDEPSLRAARAAGVPLLGDIELFARHARAPVVAVTGSNGKSTVTALVGEMARSAGRKVLVGGNIGTPALDLLAEDAPDLYVLELSSFQLEATESLSPAAAVVLNVSDDHLDRHGDIEHYAAIKARVFHGGGAVVVNRDDRRVAAMAEPGRTVLSFGEAAGADYHLIERAGRTWLACRGEPLLDVAALQMAGRHNWSNALAALALGEAVGLSQSAMLEALRRFSGLPHRCQKVAEKRGVTYYNDSKGTNVGATLAALAGMPGERVVLIAGGLGKGADFAPLAPVLASRGRAVVLIGRDATLLEAAIGTAVPVRRAASMESAVTTAAELAHPGDAVLLSPACASFDMFSGYAARGEAFVAAVEDLPT